MSSGCVSGQAKRKPSAPLKFYMDSGVLCTAFGTTNSLCKFADAVFNFFIETYALAAGGFLIDPLLKVIIDNPRVAAYYATDAGRFDLSIAARAKKLLELLETAQDVLELLDSFKLDEFDTDQFCESNPLLTPVPITYSMIVAALIPFGDGFDKLLEAVTKNWIIIKFADYCECRPNPIEPTTLPTPPPPFRGLSAQSCVGDRDAQLSLDAILANIDAGNASLAAALANERQGYLQVDIELFPTPEIQDAYLEWIALDPENRFNYPGDFPQYNLNRNPEVALAFENEPDRLFPGGDPNDPGNAYGAVTGRIFKTTFFQTPTPNRPGVSNQIFAPGQEPPCRCELVISWDKVQTAVLGRGIFIDWSGNIRRQGAQIQGNWNPNDGAAVANRVPVIGINAFAFPRLVLTGQSCPSYIVITDQDLQCLDFPDLCSCKEVLIPATVAVRTGCDIDDQEDKNIEYKDYQGASCITKTLEVEVFDKCFESLEPLVITYNAPPDVLTL
jgi:hypothetical protein